MLNRLSSNDIAELKKSQYSIRTQDTFIQGTKRILGKEHVVIDEPVLKDAQNASRSAISFAFFSHHLAQQTCPVRNSNLPDIRTVLLTLFRKLTREEIGTYIAFAFPHCATIIYAKFDEFL